MTRISFIIPTYNRASLIEESILSVAGQISQDDEIVVVDDGSTDETRHVVTSIKLPVRYVFQNNTGKSAALNRGISLTDGEYVWICDDDDILRPQAVTILTRRAEESKADVVFGKYTRFKDVAGRRVELGTGYWPNLSTGSLSRHLLEDSFAMHNATLTRRSAYISLGGFDEEFLRAQDYEMFVRIAVQANIAYTDNIIFDQRKHEGDRGPGNIKHSVTNSNNVWKEYDRKIFEKLWGSVSIEFYKSMFSNVNENLAVRAAHLQRATVMSRHDLWSYAVQDFQSAAMICPSVPLQSLERDICRRAVLGKHGFDGINEQAVLSKFRNLSRQEGVVGKSIVQNLIRGMLWRYRSPGIQEKKEASKFIQSNLNIRDLGKILFPGGMLGRKVNSELGEVSATRENSKLSNSL